MERYTRNIQLNEIGIKDQEKLLSSKILIAGVGGLGSATISSLSSAEVGTIGLIDYDTVEPSNLNRQFVHSFNNLEKYKTDSARATEK